jgi:UDP:flavonoid glycosyltransferase YjiC (YdhE family)
MKDVPDVIKPLTYFPKNFRRKIIKFIPKTFKLKIPILKQKNIMNTLQKFEWCKEPINNLFDMLKADFTIINDFEVFYKDQILPNNFKIVGPLYAPAGSDMRIDSDILKLFNSEQKNLKIYCTLGSSGKKEYLIEMIKALTKGIGREWQAIILAPPAICPLDEALSYTKNSPNVYITDSFIPAPLVNAMADIVISHGGQGTLQTAIASGTPVIGFAMQPEQQINLDNLVEAGVAIRLPIHRWNYKNIQKSIRKIHDNQTYKNNMKSLQAINKHCDGQKNAALAIWDYLLRVI